MGAIKDLIFRSKKDNGFDFSSARVIYSLRNLTEWTNAVVKIRRTSDNATAYVFFDGNEITLNSLISTTSNTTPSAITLNSWLTTSSAFLEEWISQNSNNLINANDVLSNTVISEQPQFMSGGSFILVNGKNSLLFATKQIFRVGGGLTEINSGNVFSIYSVIRNSNTETIGGYMGSISATFGFRLGFFSDRTNGKLHTRFLTPDSTFDTNLLTQQNDSNQRILSTIVKTGKVVDSYFNNTLQESLTFTNNYINDALLIGGERTNSKITGNIQEIIIFGSDKTFEKDDIHTDINNYYTIY